MVDISQLFIYMHPYRFDFFPRCGRVTLTPISQYAMSTVITAGSSVRLTAEFEVWYLGVPCVWLHPHLHYKVWSNSSMLYSVLPADSILGVGWIENYVYRPKYQRIN